MLQSGSRVIPYTVDAFTVVHLPAVVGFQIDRNWLFSADIDVIDGIVKRSVTIHLTEREIMRIFRECRRIRGIEVLTSAKIPAKGE